MNTSSYSYQPQKKKKKKMDNRVEIDGKPMSKYQRKLMEKEAKKAEGAFSEEAESENSSENIEEIPELELEKDFKGQFPPEVLEEAEELFRESFRTNPESEAGKAAEVKPKLKKRDKFLSGEDFLKPEEDTRSGNGAGAARQQESAVSGAAGRGRIRPDYRNEACLESFPCSYCGKEIRPEGAGSEHRNHCPHCLHSLHVDNEPGDRASGCHGDMEPIAIWVKDRGEWALVHRCKKCGKLSTNRVLADDNPIELMSLAVKALANPPFPLRMLSDYLGGKD